MARRLSGITVVHDIHALGTEKVHYFKTHVTVLVGEPGAGKSRVAKRSDHWTVDTTKLEAIGGTTCHQTVSLS